MEATLQQPISNTSVLDRRSFHLFEYRGDKLLYDISTGTVCELNNFSYRLLDLCGEYCFPEVLRRIYLNQKVCLCIGLLT